MPSQRSRRVSSLGGSVSNSLTDDSEAMDPIDEEDLAYESASVSSSSSNSDDDSEPPLGEKDDDASDDAPNDYNGLCHDLHASYHFLIHENSINSIEKRLRKFVFIYKKDDDSVCRT